MTTEQQYRELRKNSVPVKEYERAVKTAQALYDCLTAWQEAHDALKDWKSFGRHHTDRDAVREAYVRYKTAEARAEALADVAAWTGCLSAENAVYQD